MTRPVRQRVVLVFAALLAACPPRPPAPAPEVDAGPGETRDGGGPGTSTDLDAGTADAGNLGATDAGGAVDAGAEDAGAVDAGPVRPSWDGGIPVFTTVGPLDPPATGELPVSPLRRFTCNAGAVSNAEPIADVAGTTDEALIIKPVGAPCAFDLVYRAGTNDSPLSVQPAAYLIAVSRRFVDGVRVACASEVIHTPTPGSATEREVGDVNIRCWASATTSFTATTLAVQGGSDWAAWARALEPSATQSGVYKLTWARDFTFQFLNMSDQGRPSTDGVYEVELTWNGTTLVAGPTVKVSSRTNPFAGAPPGEWIPTAQEVRELGGIIPFAPDSGVP